MKAPSAVLVSARERRDGRSRSGLKVVSLRPGCGYGDAACQYLLGLHRLGVRLSWSPTFSTALERSGMERDRYLSASMTRELKPLWERPLDWDTLLVHRPPARLPTRLRDAVPRDRRFAYVAWEVARIPPEWNRLLAEFDRVLVPSEFTRNALLEAGLEAEIDVVPHVARRQVAAPDTPDTPGALADAGYVFYTIGTWTQRKAIEETLRAYLDTFDARDDVVLAIKTDAVDRIALDAIPPAERDVAPSHLATAWWRVAQILGEYPRPARVHLMTDRLSAAGIDALHHRGDCFVSLSRSEGWGLPAFDAALAGNPVIITGWGGQLDYLGASYPLLVDYDLAEIGTDSRDCDFRKVPTAVWARARRSHAGARMREVFADRQRARRIGERLRPQLEQRYSAESVCRRLAGLMRVPLGAINSGDRA